MISQPIKLKDRGDNVRTIQASLNDRLPYTLPELPITGVFDDKTKTRVQEFQRLYQLTSDGAVGPLTWALLVGEPYEITLFPPGMVLQETNQYLCWASVLESWLAANVDRPWSAAEDLRNKFSEYTGDYGGLLPKGWGAVARKFRMTADMFPHPKMGRTIGNFIADYVHAKLKQKKYLVMVYNISPVLAHTVLIYGLKVEYNQVYVQLMDPWNGGGDGGFRTKALGYYRTKTFIGVLWAS